MSDRVRLNPSLQSEQQMIRPDCLAQRTVLSDLKNEETAQSIPTVIIRAIVKRTSSDASANKR